MYLYGSFADRLGQLVTVHILSGNDRTEEVEIGTDGCGVYFGGDEPVKITCESNDIFDHLIRHSATIRLLVDRYIPELFGVTFSDVAVNIYRGNECLFAGYVEPQSYNQPYNEVLDDLELNCIDALSAMQYSYYKNIGIQGVTYESVKASATQRTFHAIVTEILSGVTTGLDVAGGQTVRLLYDSSKAVDDDSANRNLILQQLKLSELAFLGDSEDDVWQQDEVLEEIFRYLNLHIVQAGFSFYLFSWETIKAGTTIHWRDLLSGQIVTSSYSDITIATAIAEDCDTQVNVGEVFNQVQVTCEINEIENVIESPLDDDALIQLYSANQQYCTEYSVEGDGSRARETFVAICQHGDVTYWERRRGGTSQVTLDYREGCITDWFIRVKTANGWKFPRRGDETTDLVDICCQNNTLQQELPRWLAYSISACIMSWGKVDTNLAHTDNSPVPKINMDDCLVVSVNGNGDDDSPQPDIIAITASIPVAVYEGNAAGGVFSPADDNVTNYLVVSGKIALNPLMEMSCDFSAAYAGEVNSSTPAVPSRDNEDGRYYTRLYWSAPTPNDEPTKQTPNPSWGLIPFSGKGPELYEFKYSGIGDSTDQVSKVAVLACMLVIGDKCVVETGTNGTPSDFHWQTYKTREQCASDDEYYNQCFFIGFDPKIGDKLIGTEFDIQNNIDYTMGIDAEGIAIPITKADKVSGQVSFKVLGPVNTYWDEWTRRHPTWFRHTSYSANSVPLLAHTSNIVVKGLEIKAYSDNGGLESAGDNDLVYLSDTNERFYNKKEIDFKIVSALSAVEASEMGVAISVNMNTPENTETGDGVTTIYDANALNTAKPEEQYVDSYYRESHVPRLLMEQTLTDSNGGVVSMFNHYTHPALGKSFYVLGVTRDLKDGSARIRLREIGNE